MDVRCVRRLRHLSFSAPDASTSADNASGVLEASANDAETKSNPTECVGRDVLIWFRARVRHEAKLKLRKT